MPDRPEFTLTFTAADLEDILLDAEVEIRLGGSAPGIVNAPDLADFIINELINL